MEIDIALTNDLVTTKFGGVVGGAGPILGNALSSRGNRIATY
jgi:hypothetical protein